MRRTEEQEERMIGFHPEMEAGLKVRAEPWRRPCAMFGAHLAACSTATRPAAALSSLPVAPQPLSRASTADGLDPRQAVVSRLAPDGPQRGAPSSAVPAESLAREEPDAWGLSWRRVRRWSSWRR